MPKSYNTTKSYSYGWKSNTWKTGTQRTGAGYRSGQTTAYNTTQYPSNSPKFRATREECEWRIGSYRNVYSQFNANQKTAFSPNTASKWVRYVNNGSRVYKFTTQQFSKFFGTAWNWQTPSSAKQFLRKKFGACVKDVVRGNNNTWLVATTKNVTGRAFTTYNWY